MQILAISKPKDAFERQFLSDHHRLRAEVFSGRLGWDVVVKDGLEIDRFDEIQPTYILAVDDDQRVAGCARLLPAKGPTMVQDVFATLLPSGKLNAHPAMIESSRFCVDTGCQKGRGTATHKISLMMFAGIIEWSLLNGFTEIVTVTDIRFERILARVGWPLDRLGPLKKIGVTMAVAGTLPATEQIFRHLRPAGYLSRISTPSSQAA